MVTIPLLFHDLESLYLLRCDFVPRYREVSGIEFEFQDALHQPSGLAAGADVFEFVDRAFIAPIDDVRALSALRTRAGSAGIFYLPTESALVTGDIVGIRASPRSLLSSVTEFMGADGAVNQKPERYWRRPFVRR